MVIESQPEYNSFLDKYKKCDCIMIPILCDSTRHVCNNNLNFIFIKFIGKSEYYILPYYHNDCVNLSMDKLCDLNSDNKKYTLDKKLLLHIYKFKNVIDINLLQYLNTNLSIEFNKIYTEPPSHSCIKNEYSALININCSLPILKYEEGLSKTANTLESIILSNIQSESEPCFDFINSNTIECFNKIEYSGLHINYSHFLEHFPDSKDDISHDNKIYTEYNIYTSTGRPSNRYNNINYAALNKDNGERKFITSRHKNGILVLFDYDAYHLRLVAKMINFNFPKDINVHTYLGKFYFNKDTLTQDEYNTSKELSFEILYGGIHDTVAFANPYFGLTKKFISKMWDKFNIDGFIETMLSKRKLYQSVLKNMNANKLFNYILQNFETERNVSIIQDLHSYLEKFNSKLVLYAYDGFLIDFDPSDSKDVLLRIKEILENNGEFPVKIYAGYNFNDMQKLNSFS